VWSGCGFWPAGAPRSRALETAIPVFLHGAGWLRVATRGGRSMVRGDGVGVRPLGGLRGRESALWPGGVTGRVSGRRGHRPAVRWVVGRAAGARSGVRGGGWVGGGGRLEADAGLALVDGDGSGRGDRGRGHLGDVLMAGPGRWGCRVAVSDQLRRSVDEGVGRSGCAVVLREVAAGEHGAASGGMSFDLADAGSRGRGCLGVPSPKIDQVGRSVALGVVGDPASIVRH